MGTEAIFKDEFTLRDQIAIKAMQGLLASNKVFFTDDELAERALENNIPTAEQYLKKLDSDNGTIWTEDDDEICKALIEFAQLRCYKKSI